MKTLWAACTHPRRITTQIRTSAKILANHVALLQGTSAFGMRRTHPLFVAFYVALGLAGLQFSLTDEAEINELIQRTSNGEQSAARTLARSLASSYDSVRRRVFACGGGSALVEHTHTQPPQQTLWPGQEEGARVLCEALRTDIDYAFGVTARLALRRKNDAQLQQLLREGAIERMVAAHGTQPDDYVGSLTLAASLARLAAQEEMRPRVASIRGISRTLNSLRSSRYATVRRSACIACGYLRGEGGVCPILSPPGEEKTWSDFQRKVMIAENASEVRHLVEEDFRARMKTTIVASGGAVIAYQLARWYNEVRRYLLTPLDRHKLVWQKVGITSTLYAAVWAVDSYFIMRVFAELRHPERTPEMDRQTSNRWRLWYGVPRSSLLYFFPFTLVPDLLMNALAFTLQAPPEFPPYSIHALRAFWHHSTE